MEKKQLNMKFEKQAQNVVEYVYQVFYHKIALNHYRAKSCFLCRETYWGDYTTNSF